MPECAASQSLLAGRELAPAEDREYVMISRLELQGFKCFKNARLDLKKFNVIVGASGSGKTSLLEAAFLHGGVSPEIYFRLRGWRGFVNQLTLSGTRDSYNALFLDMFYNFDKDSPLAIKVLDSDGNIRDLKVYFRDDKNYSLPLDKMDQHAFLVDPIVFEWNVGGKEYQCSLEIKEGRLQFTGSAPPGNCAFYNAVNLSSLEDASYFSSLSKRFKSHKLNNEVAKVFEGYGDVSLELIGGSAILHIGAGLPEKLPLVDLSGGIRKYVAIALGILINPKGTVIVDEFDSGFYYDHLPAIWESMVRLCEDNETQLIVSTHSYEFLKAISPSLERDPMQHLFQLIRLEKGDGQPRIKVVEGGAYRAAIASDFEVR